MPPYEHVLRDALAQRLDLLEPGLRLVDCEFPLPNAVGTRGSIDILARDQHNLWVVIELKRSNEAAGRALHEVAKYTELLCREKHISPDRIRAIIVSTIWPELLVPVSHMARNWTHDLRGYHLKLHDDGSLSHADRVDLLPRASEHNVSPIHVMYFFNTPEERDTAWSAITKLAGEVGAHDLLAANFQRVAELDKVVAAYGLYLAIGKVDLSLAAPEIRGPYDGPEPFTDRYPAEYQTLCHITSRVLGATMESAVPGTLRNISGDPRWVIEGYRGAGALGGAGAHEDRDLFKALVGDDVGQAQIKFEGAANPQVHNRWTSFREEAQTSLAGNADWGLLVPAWLGKVAEDPAVNDVVLDVYNPCDFVGALYHGWPDNLQRFIPLLIGGAAREDGTGSAIVGGLYWDGWGGLDIGDRITSVYPEPADWLVGNYGGLKWLHDSVLIKELGLRYMLIEYSGQLPVGIDAESTYWIAQEGEARQFSPRNDRYELCEIFHSVGSFGKPQPLSKFISCYKHQLNSEVIRFRNSLGYMPPI